MNDVAYFETVQADNWTLHHGDCVHVAKMIDSNSIGFSVYSPPFSNLYIYSDSEYSNMSAFCQSISLHIDSNVENRIAFAFPDFKIEIFAVVIPIISASSLLFIFLLASITSRFIIIAIN